MRCLLDVNVLIALLDAGHVHHPLATRWLAGKLAHGWASCPLTQNGCVRIMSAPSYPAPLSAAQVAIRLQEATRHASHEFWSDDVSLVDGERIDWTRVLGHRQVTDVYLLALAVEHRGRFVTFDKRVLPAAVRGAEAKHIEVVTA